MNCYLHPDTAATAFCRACGRPLCAVCQRPADGTVYCQDHVPVAAAGYSGAGYANQGYANSGYANPAYAKQGYAPPPDPNLAGAPNPYFQTPPPPGVQTSPGLAFGLGWIPGVGAICNGQYLKGLVHAIIFGLLMSLTNSTEGSAGQPLLIMMTIGFVFYMPFEAYHTAKKRQMGVPVDEWSSLIGQTRPTSRVPLGPILLIVIGVLFLLDTLHLIDFRQIGKFWPVILIAVGAYMLYARVAGAPARNASASQPYPAERPANSTVETPHE